MGFTSYFLDNVSYGAEDVSNAFAKLTKSGVLAYPTDSESPTEAINTIIASLSTAGITGYNTGCIPTLSDGVVTIGAGTVIFNDGVMAVIDTGGVSIDVGDEAVYIWAEHSYELNMVRFLCGDELPDSDYVPLCRVTIDGELLDMREYARSTLVPQSENIYKYFSFPITIPRTAGESVTFDLGCSVSNNYLILNGGNYAGRSLCFEVEDGWSGISKSAVIPLNSAGGVRLEYMTPNASNNHALIAVADIEVNGSLITFTFSEISVICRGANITLEGVIA